MPFLAASVNTKQCLADEQKFVGVFHIDLISGKKIRLEFIGKVLELCDIV